MILTKPDRQLVREQSLACGIAIGEYAFHGGGVLQPHHHDTPRVCLVVSGLMREQRGRAELSRATGSSTYLAPGTPHREEFSPIGVRVLAIDLPPAWLDAHGVEIRNAPSTLGELRSIAPIAWRMRDQLRHPDEFSALELEGLALELTAGLLRAARTSEAPAPAWLLAVRAALDAAPAQQPSVAALAAYAGVTPARLMVQFRRYFGQSMAACVRERRLETARALLRTSKDPLGRIAIMAGYSDQSHMTRWFRRQVGMTPQAFRLRFGRA